MLPRAGRGNTAPVAGRLRRAAGAAADAWRGPSRSIWRACRCRICSTSSPPPCSRPAPATPLGEKGRLAGHGGAGWCCCARACCCRPTRQPAGGRRRRRTDCASACSTLQAAQALARWLEHRPQLGQDVFARGQPELLGTALEAQHEVDVIEFLWACLALFDDGAAMPDTTPVYRRPGAICTPPRCPRAHPAPAGRDPGGTPLGQLPARPRRAAGRGRRQRRAAATLRLEQHLRRQSRTDPAGPAGAAADGEFRGDPGARGRQRARGRGRGRRCGKPGAGGRAGGMVKPLPDTPADSGAVAFAGWLLVLRQRSIKTGTARRSPKYIEIASAAGRPIGR